MGKNRKKSTKLSADELLIAALIFPIALICAYPIILVWILVLVGAVILCVFLGNSSERKKKKEMQKAAAELDKLRSELDHSIIEDATNEGMQKGIQQGALETAKRMLKKGGFSYEEIAELTTLTVEAVQELAVGIM